MRRARAFVDAAGAAAAAGLTRATYAGAGCRHHYRRSPLVSSGSGVGLRLLSSRSKPTPTGTAAAAGIKRSVIECGTGFTRWYLGMIETRPVLTKSVTACTIYAVADISSQIITFGPGSLDVIRTMRMASYGLLISGPTLHLWFNYVSKFFPKRDVLTTIKKMALGQILYGPTFTAIFFSYNAALQGETFHEISARLKRDLIQTLKSGLVYWPLCDFITFRFIPVRLQPLVSNSFAYIWTIYITYMASLQKASSEEITAA